MTSVFLASLMLLTLSAAAFAQELSPDAITKSVSQCPAAVAAFRTLTSFKEPVQTVDQSLMVVNSCIYIKRLRSEIDIYAQALSKCAAQGQRGLAGEVKRVETLKSKLPDTPQVCEHTPRARP